MPGTSNSGGRNAKSPDQHKAQGTYQKVRHEGFDTPDPPKGHPVCPKSLSVEARAEWDRMVSRLEQSKTLAVVDDAALYQYVNLFAETEEIKTDNISVRKLSAQLKRSIRNLEGPDLVDAIKEIVKLQFVLDKQTTKLRQQRMAIRMYLVEFGQTPGSRTRVKIAKESKPKSKLVAFRGGKDASAGDTESAG